MKLFSFLLLAAFLFVNEAAFGKIVQLDQINVVLEIPDDFVQQDISIENSVYSAFRSGPNGSMDTIRVSYAEGTGDFTDARYVNRITEDYVRSGFRVISCETKDIGSNRYLVSELRSSDLSEVKYDICSGDHTISIIFIKSPSVRSLLGDDPTVINVMSTLFVGASPADVPTLGANRSVVILTVVGIVVGIFLIGKIYNLSKSLSQEA
jgi:hypothetical protein